MDYKKSMEADLTDDNQKSSEKSFGVKHKKLRWKSKNFGKKYYILCYNKDNYGIEERAV